MTLQTFSVKDQLYLLQLSSSYFPSYNEAQVEYDGTLDGFKKLTYDGEVGEVLSIAANSFFELGLDAVEAIHIEKYGIPVLTVRSPHRGKRLVIDLRELEIQARRLRFLNRFSRALMVVSVTAMCTAFFLSDV
jgi:CHASE3 domain sensor protein